MTATTAQLNKKVAVTQSIADVTLVTNTSSIYFALPEVKALNRNHIEFKSNIFGI